MKKNVTVTFDVSVEVDESKFTDEFMQDFREVFYGFNVIEDHVKYLAQLKVRGLLDDWTEGYGDLSNMGIKVNVRNWGEEIDG